MAGSPVVLVLDDVLSGFPSNSVFRQVELTVNVMLNTTGTSRQFPFLHDVSGDTLLVNLSTALRSMLDSVEYQSEWVDWDTVKYPFLTFSIDAREKYMVDGEIYYGHLQSFCANSKAVPGRISEMDRLRITNHVADYYNKLRFTGKPMDGVEIVPQNERVVTYEYSATQGVVGSGQTMSELGLHTLNDKRKVYVVPEDDSLFSLRFVNSYGVIDTATAICFESLAYKVSTAQYNLTKEPSNLKPSGMEAQKSGGKPTLTLSSGHVSRQWADWWAEEVMRTTKCWIKFGNSHRLMGDSWMVEPLWLPCILTPKDEEITVYDRSSLGLCSVEFKAEISLEGSLLRTVIS